MTYEITYINLFPFSRVNAFSRYDALYHHSRPRAMEALDSLPDLMHANQLKAKILFSVVVVSYLLSKYLCRIYIFHFQGWFSLIRRISMWYFGLLIDKYCTTLERNYSMMFVFDIRISNNKSFRKLINLLNDIPKELLVTIWPINHVYWDRNYFSI